MEPDSPVVFLQKIARLQSLLEATRSLHATIDLREILLCAVTIAAKEVESPGTFILPGPGQSAVPYHSFGAVPEGISESASADSGIGFFDLSAGDGPALARLGVLPRPGRPFAPEEVDFLESLALQASLALQNALHHEEGLRWERVRRDMDTARAIQRSLLPKEMPAIPGYAAAARSEPCYEVGGDYLDILATPGGGYLLVVADVAGKGLASALIGSSFRASIRAMAASSIPLDDMAARLNDLHFEDGEEARRKYVTAIFARILPDRHLLEVVNAGHTSGILVLGEDGHRLLKSTGTPLGMLPGRGYRLESLEFPPGAALLLYTDGLSEASRGGQEFGPDRLLERTRQLRSGNPSTLLESLWSEISAFEDGCGPCDDKTALALMRAP